MRATITNNRWNTTEWGLGFLRVGSFPLDPSCIFETQEEFQNYLEGNYADKPYPGQILTVKNGKFNIFIVQEFNGSVWTAKSLLDDVQSPIENIYYDESRGALIITHKDSDGVLQETVVPISGQVSSFDVDNSTGVVELTKTSTGEEADRLSADIRISSRDDNILIRDGNSLYVENPIEWYEG